MFITCLSISVAFMTGCTPEEYKVEVQAVPEKVEEIKVKTLRKVSLRKLLQKKSNPGINLWV
ncbi:hypothetical protein [Natranaerobius trueperi]|uniref:hypothetical protein n=1 Tax=Natranaerobius trueperi TaxID=759412 RepID=UPI0013033167|nr:hypothetical protein [Natranaerobius trueperi]